MLWLVLYPDGATNLVYNTSTQEWDSCPDPLWEVVEVDRARVLMFFISDSIVHYRQRFIITLS